MVLLCPLGVKSLLLGAMLMLFFVMPSILWILAIWLESGYLKASPSFRRFTWDVSYSLGADLTDSHHFENESFDFGVPISPSEFQWGVEIVRLFQPSWQDDRNRGMWFLPSFAEETLRGTQTMLADRSKLYGLAFVQVSRSIFTMDMAKYQLFGLNHLLEQGILDFKSLSPRKLEAIQLALGLTSKKLLKTLAISNNRPEVRLSNFSPLIPDGLWLASLCVVLFVISSYYWSLYFGVHSAFNHFIELTLSFFAFLSVYSFIVLLS